MIEDFLKIKAGVYVRPSCITHLEIFAIGTTIDNPSDYDWDHLRKDMAPDVPMKQVDIKVRLYIQSHSFDGMEGGPECYHLIGRDAEDILFDLDVPFNKREFIKPYMHNLEQKASEEAHEEDN